MSTEILFNTFQAQDMLAPYNSTEKDYRYGPTKRFDEYDHYQDDFASPYARSTKRPATPPPGAVTNPNVARYQEHVERHIDRCAVHFNIDTLAIYRHFL